MAGTFAVGMDLGGTNARAAAVDERGKILAVKKVPLAGRDPESAADALATCAKEALAASGRDRADCAGFGIGVAGQVEAGTQKVLVAPNLGWRDVEFAPLLQQRLGAPVRLANDLSVAALGEARAGSAKGYPDAILVFVGSGVGSGLILGGRIFEGARGVAGEFGHVKVRPGGRLCGCGEHGCLEAYAGGHNLGARAAEAMAEGRHTILAVPEGLRPTADMLERAARQGDALSQELLDDAALLVGVATANVVTLLNPAALFLGGGVLFGSPRMRQGVEQAVRDNANRAALERLVIVDPVLGDDAGVIGAAFLAREGVVH